MHQHPTISAWLMAVLLSLLCLGIAASTLTLVASAATATPTLATSAAVTDDIRAGLLADLDAFEARYGSCIFGGDDDVTLPRYAWLQSYLIGHPELNRYLTWVYPRRSIVGLCRQNWRDERNLRDYLAQR